ncbi:MAG: hypothetical protein NZ839_04905 [Endomicrobia bacterium]|nr:hypothetical protein [Endomicrobiia bacterium]
MGEVKNNVNINNNVLLSKTKENSGSVNKTESNNLNINVNNNSTSFTPLNAKIADVIGYTQDLISSSTFTAQEFVEQNPAFAFKTVAEQLKSSVLSGVYSSFSEVVDKLLLGAFRGVTLGLDTWQFIKKLREKNNIKKLIDEKTSLLNQEIEKMSEEQRSQLKNEIQKLLRDLEEKKIDLGVSGGRVITDLLGVVGAVAAAFSLPALATAAPYLIGIALVGDIVGISYYAYKSIKDGIENFTQKIAQRRNKEMKTNTT